MRKLKNNPKINNMLAEFSNQLGLDIKPRNTRGRNMIMMAAGIIGFSVVRRMINGSKQ